jgi:hypothetical protein
VGAGGASLMIFPVTSTAMASLDANLAGLASGLLNVGRQLGGAIGLAVLVTIADTVTRHSHADLAVATVDGYRAALLVGAGVSLVTTLLALPCRSQWHRPPWSTRCKRLQTFGRWTGRASLSEPVQYESDDQKEHAHIRVVEPDFSFVG